MAEVTRAAEVLHGVLGGAAGRVLTVVDDTAVDAPPFYVHEAPLHDARVALRRIRSMLRTFHVLLDPQFSTTLRADVAWLDERLGTARDLQLVVKILEVNAPLVCRPHKAAALIELASCELEASWQATSVAVADPRFAQLHQHLVRLVGESPTGATYAASDLRRVLRRAKHDVDGAAARAKKDPSMANLHTLRIRTKALRYGAEAVGLVDGLPAYRCAKAAENLQGRLGAVQDCARAIAWLEHTGANHPQLLGPTAALTELEQHGIEVATTGWRRDVRAIDKRWEEWGRALKRSGR